MARIVPVDQPSPLERLISEGLVQPARNSDRTLPEPVTATGSVTELIAEQCG